MVVVQYGMLVRDAAGSTIISLPLQTEAIACPAVGSFFEVQGITAGRVIEATTILHERSQQSSSAPGQRIFTHVVTLAAATAVPSMPARTPAFPEETVARSLGHHNFQREWSVDLWPHQPHAPLASLIGSQFLNWSSVRGAEVLTVGPGGSGVPSPSQFGFIGMEFAAQRRKSYAFEIFTDEFEDDMHMTYFTSGGNLLHSAVVRSDRPGHWFIMCPPMPIEEVCRVTSSRLNSAIDVRQVSLHCISLR